jgi:hypothetical protein
VIEGSKPGVVIASRFGRRLKCISRIAEGRGNTSDKIGGGYKPINFWSSAAVDG